MCTTFHNYEDGWYLILPEEWLAEVTVARRDSSGSTAASERAVSFYHYWPDGAESPEEFLTIYRLTGTNRAHRAAIDGRIKLVESSDMIYAAKFQDAQWNCGIDRDKLQEQFNRIRVDWSVEN